MILPLYAQKTTGIYSEMVIFRAEYDSYNRICGIEHLRKAYKSGHLTKQQVNKHGYNKYLKISKDVEVLISQDKIAENDELYTKTHFLTDRHQTIKPIFDHLS